MNVLYYIPNISKEFGGIYQYSMGLLNSLSKAELNHNFYVYNLNNEEEVINIINRNKNFKLISDSISSTHNNYRRLLSYTNQLLRIFNPSTRTFNIPHPLQAILDKYKIDIIHTPYQDLVKTSRTPGITTMHDVQELHFPEFFSSSERARRAVNYKNSIDNADYIIVSYEHVKNDIVRYFDKSIDKVQVVLLDMQDLWFDRFTSDDITDLNHYNLPQNFLLYPASTWEHKNHIRLIEAIHLIRQKYHKVINLICTGHKTAYYKNTVEPKINNLGLNDTIKFLGIVNDKELYSLYHKCRAVVIPTLYEAGSFPLMESILMNIPVICSNVTSLPETIGDNEFLFNPLDIEDIAAKVLRICEDENFRIKNCQCISIQGVNLRKTKAAEKIDAIYKSVHEKRINYI